MKSNKRKGTKSKKSKKREYKINKFKKQILYKLYGGGIEEYIVKDVSIYGSNKKMKFIKNDNIVGEIDYYINNDKLVINLLFINEKYRGNKLSKLFLNYFIKTNFDQHPLLNFITLENRIGTDQYPIINSDEKTKKRKIYSEIGFIYDKPGHSYFGNDMTLTRDKFIENDTI